MDCQLLQGDSLEKLKDLPTGSVDCCITSPPYFNLRDYGVEGQIGTEDNIDGYVGRLVEVFSEVKRVLKPEGSLWLNLGDSYAGSNKGSTASGKYICGPKQATSKGTTTGNIKPTKVKGLAAKQLIGIPWRVAFALQDDGWILRSDIIWHKPNAMPESVKDRPTRSHEHIFLFVKQGQYYYDAEAIKEPTKALRPEGKNAFRGQDAIRPKGKKRSNWQQSKTRNKRDVWEVATKPFREAHFAIFPEKLIEPCVLAGSPEGGLVLDPFSGAATTGLVALDHGRRYIGIELNTDYIEIAKRRFSERQA